MSKSRARFLSELLGTTGLVKKSKSALAGADEVIDLSVLPSIPNSKLTNSSITINSSATSLGGSVTLTTANVAENTNLYFTNARADARITAALIDEDNMSSDSATRIPSQQSVKAYVDTEVAGLVDSAPGTLNTLNELAAALGDDANFSTTVTNSIATKLPLAGGTLTGNLNLGDNGKAIFGAGSDLQIYHDTNHSYIEDAGTGALKLKGDDIRLENSSGNNIIKAVNNSAELYENGSKKLETTASGIDVTGTASATNVSLPDDGVLSLGSSDELTIKHHNSGYSHLTNTTGTLFIDSDSVTFRDDDGSPSNMVVSQTGIDVTGTVTTDGLTSAGDVAITGGSSGSTVLTLTTNALTDTPLMVFQRTGGAVAGKLAYEDGNTAMAFGTTTAHELKLLTNNTNRLEIDSSGNVGIGVTPDGALSLESPSYAAGGIGNGIRFQNGNNTADAIIQSYYSGTSSSALLHGVNSYLSTGAAFTVIDTNKPSSYFLQNTNGSFDFGSAQTGNPSSKVTIDTSGNVGIAYSTPSSFNSSANNLVIGSGASGDNTGLTIYSNSDASGSIHFADSTSGTNAYVGDIYYNHTSNFMAFLTNATEAMRIQADGTVAVGTTDLPAWNTSVFDGRIRIGARGALVTTTASTQLTHNTYYNGSYKYIGNDFATRYYSNDGDHVWLTAPSGSADATISFSSPRMIIKNTGNVGIGKDTPTARLDVLADSTVWAAQIKQENTSNGDGLFVSVGSNLAADYALSVRTNDGAYSGLAVKADGKVGIGTFTPNSGLHVFKAPDGGNATTHIYQDGATNAPTLKIQQVGNGGNPNVTQGLLIEMDGTNDGSGNLIRAIGKNSNVNSGNDVEAFIVKGGGDVLVGSTSNLDVLSGTPKLQIGDGDGHSSLQFYSKSDSVGALYFGDTTTGTGRYPGYIEYRHSNNTMAFRAADLSVMTLHSTGPLLPAGNFGYNSTQEFYYASSAATSFSTSTDITYTSSTAYWPDKGEKLICTLNARAFTKYLHIKTNLTSDNIMHYFRTRGYFYSYGFEEQVIGGYTYQGGIIQKSTETVAGNSHTLNHYRAQDGSLVLKVDVNQQGYTEGRMLVLFHAHSESVTRALQVTAVRQKDDGTNPF